MSDNTAKKLLSEDRRDMIMQKLLLEILNEIKGLRAANDEIWNVDDIARYLRLSRSSVQSRVICRKDFPRAVRIPTNNGLGGRRFYAKEIKQWVKRNREPYQKRA